MAVSDIQDCYQAGGAMFKLELVYKIVVLGALALATKLSWNAWESAQSTQAKIIDTLNTLDRRVYSLEQRHEIYGWSDERPSK